MIRTESTRTLAPAGFAPAGKPTRAYCGLLLVLALCRATTAWSQTAPPFNGRRVPPDALSRLRPARSSADTPASAQYRFVNIEIPGANGGTANCAYCDSPYGIDDAGLVVGQYTTDDGSTYYGFAWRDGILRTLDYPGSVDTETGGVNNRGVVAVDYSLDGATWHSATYAFPSGAWTTLPDIPGYSVNVVYEINDLGVAVGQASGASTAVSWIWDPSSQSYSFFAVPGSAQNSTAVAGINDKGQMVGWFTDASSVTHGFLKEGETYTTIDPPGSTRTFAFEINNSGTIVGWWGSYGEGFVRTSDGAYTILNVPGSLGTEIYAISDHGDICGIQNDAKTGLWTPFVGYKQ